MPSCSVWNASRVAEYLLARFGKQSQLRGVWVPAAVGGCGVVGPNLSGRALHC